MQPETYKWVFSYDEPRHLNLEATISGNKYCHGYNYLTIYQPGAIRPCQFSSLEQIPLKSGCNSVLRLMMGIVLIQLQHYKT